MIETIEIIDLLIGIIYDNCKCKDKPITPAELITLLNRFKNSIENEMIEIERAGIVVENNYW